MRVLLDSFLLHLRAERKSAQTVKSYRDRVRAFCSFTVGATPRMPAGSVIYSPPVARTS